MNPFAALDVSDDEDQKFTTTAGSEQKPAKKCNLDDMQLISKERKLNKLRFVKLSKEEKLPHQPLKKYHRKSKKTQERKDIIKWFHQRKSQPPVTISIGEVELDVLTDLVNRVEDMVVLET